MALSLVRFRRGLEIVEPTVEEEDNIDDDDELRSLKGSDDEADDCLFFNPEVDFKGQTLLLRSQKFPDKLVLKKALIHHAVQNRYDFYYEHNGNKRITTYCRHKCKCIWNSITSKFPECTCGFKRKCTYTVYATPMGSDGVWQIRSIDLGHHCVFRGTNKKVNAEYLAEKYLEDWRINPCWKIKNWQKQIKRDLGVNAKYGMCWLARSRAKLVIYGDCAHQYGRVWDYVGVVIKHIPGSTAIVTVDSIERPPPYFQRMYICLKPVKDGYLNGCRPIIGVDGCHLKGAYPGICLVAVGMDGNNNIYPVAWAVVETKNGSTWTWFLNMLMEDLGKVEGQGLTIMSDRQKGILEAFNIVTPKADIRFCVRHIWANFKLQFTGSTFKDSFWKAARAGTKAEFEFQMKCIKYLSERAYAYLSHIGDHHWSRHAFNTNCKSNMLLNNMCEVFNNVLRECRDKPILTQMEWMRRYVMKRHYDKRDGVRKYEGRVMPYVDKFLKWAVKEADCCDVYASSNENFEAEYMSKQYVVDLTAHTCTCFHWQLCGLPCQHAIACIFHQRADYEDFVDVAYTREKYMQCYSLPIPPISDITQWEKVDLVEPLPPPTRKMPGRPSHKKRRKEAGEGTSGQVPKKPRLQRTCRKCGQVGHNVKTCKNSGHVIVQPTKPTSQWTERYRAQVEARKAKKQHDAEVISMVAGGSQQQSQTISTQASHVSQRKKGRK